MTKKSKIITTGCLITLLCSASVLAEPSPNPSPSIKTELPIAPVGNGYTQGLKVSNENAQLIETLLNQLNQLINQINQQNNSVNYASISKSKDHSHTDIHYQHSTPLILIKLSPALAQLILQDFAADPTLLHILKTAKEKNIALYFYPEEKPAFNNLKKVIEFCAHYNVVFAPIKFDPYWIIKSFNPMIGRFDTLKMPLDKFPPFRNLTPDQQKEVVQTLPHFRFVDGKGGYYVMHPKDEKLNIYYYDKQVGQRTLIKQENMPKIGDSLFNHAFNEMINHLKQATERSEHHETDDHEKNRG